MCRGFAIFEILISFTILTLVFAPVLSVIRLVYISNTNLYSFFDEYKTKGVRGIETVTVPNGSGVICPLFTGEMSLTSYSSGDIGIGTSTKIVSLKSLGGKLVLGLDSSEASDPDIALLNTDTLKVQSGLNLSPGTTDISFSGTRVFVSHSGVASDISFVDVYPELIEKRSCAIKNDRRDGRVAQAVQTIGDMVVLGFEKNNGPELFLLDLECNSMDAIELGFGVHDIYVVDDMLYVLGPSNPELLVYKIINSKFRLIKSLDLEGESGNARSLDYVHTGLIFGRSRGNDELVFLDSDLHIADSVKIGSSVDQIISGTTTLILLTSNSDKELQIMKDKTIVKYSNLPSRAQSGVCLGNRLYIGTHATTSALVVIEEI